MKTSSCSLRVLPNARRVATARAALNAAMAARADLPAICDEAVIDLLADLRHFCSARHIDFSECDRVACSHYQTEIAGGRS